MLNITQVQVLLEDVFLGIILTRNWSMSYYNIIRIGPSQLGN